MIDEFLSLDLDDARGLGARAQNLAEAARPGRPRLAAAHVAVAKTALMVLRYNEDGRAPDRLAVENVVDDLRLTVRTLAPVDRDDFASAWDAEVPGAGSLAPACMAIAHCADVDDSDDVGALVDDLSPEDADEMQRALLDAELDLASQDGLPGASQEDVDE